jgi:Homeodomain-like domain
MKRRAEAERARALALRNEGLSIRAIAERLGVPSRTVGRWLHGRGDCHAVRSCELCGEPFIAVSARHRFCTPAHQRKHSYVFGASTLHVIGDRAQPLPTKLPQLPGRRLGVATVSAEAA